MEKMRQGDALSFRNKGERGLAYRDSCLFTLIITVHTGSRNEVTEVPSKCLS
jgi:hypothetical protein